MAKKRESYREEQLLDYLEGELDIAARAKIEAHLAHCSTCRRNVQALETTLEKAAGASVPPQNVLYAGSFVYKVRQRLANQNGQVGRRVWEIGLSGVVCLLAVFAWWQQDPSEAPGYGDMSLGVAEPVQQQLEQAYVVETAEDLAQTIDDYLLETASADELLDDMEEELELVSLTTFAEEY